MVVPEELQPIIDDNVVMEDAVQIGLVDAAEEAVGLAMARAEQSEVANLQTEIERRRQSEAAKDEEIQQLKNELTVERQQNMSLHETLRHISQTANDGGATADPKIWEQRLTDYLAKVSCSSGTGLGHAGLSGRGHQVLSIVHPCFERLENHRERRRHSKKL